MKILIIIALIFILADFISGLFMALVTKSFESSKMRMGLVHKITEVYIIALGFLCEWAFPFIGLDIPVPIVETICTYIVIMELGSIIENLVKINPDSDNLLTKIFGGFLKDYGQNHKND